MKVKELIKKLQECNPELEVNTFNINSENPINYWVIDIVEHSTGSSGYEEEGEVLIITEE